MCIVVVEDAVDAVVHYNALLVRDGVFCLLLSWLYPHPYERFVGGGHGFVRLSLLKALSEIPCYATGIDC